MDSGFNLWAKDYANANEDCNSDNHSLIHCFPFKDEVRLFLEHYPHSDEDSDSANSENAYIVCDIQASASLGIGSIVNHDSP